MYLRSLRVKMASYVVHVESERVESSRVEAEAKRMTSRMAVGERVVGICV
jgi:hypothetical protein